MLLANVQLTAYEPPRSKLVTCQADSRPPSMQRPLSHSPRVAVGGQPREAGVVKRVRLARRRLWTTQRLPYRNAKRCEAELRLTRRLWRSISRSTGNLDRSKIRKLATTNVTVRRLCQPVCYTGSGLMAQTTDKCRTVTASEVMSV